MNELEAYIRESLAKAGKTQEEIDRVVKVILSLRFMNSKEAVDAFIKASQ